MRNFAETLSRRVARLSDIAVMAMTAILVTSLILQVISRYVFGRALVWTEELALLMFAWTIMLMAATLLRTAGHVRLEALVALLPAPLRGLVLRLVSVVVLGFCLVVLYSGVQYVQATLGMRSAAVRYPLELLHGSVLAFGIVGAIHAFARMLSPYEPDEPDSSGEAPA